MRRVESAVASQQKQLSVVCAAVVPIRYYSKQEGGHKNYPMPSNGWQNPLHYAPTRRPISIHYNCLLSAFFVVSLRFISISFSAVIVVVVFVGIIVVGFGRRLSHTHRATATAAVSQPTSQPRALCCLTKAHRPTTTTAKTILILNSSSTISPVCYSSFCFGSGFLSLLCPSVA